MSIEDNIALIQKFLAAVSDGRIQQVDDMIADDFSWTVMKSGFTSASAWDKSTYLKLLSGTPDILDGPLTLAPTGWTAQDDRVAVEAESLAVTRSGRSYNNLYHFLFRVRDGLVVSGREYMDSSHAESVFGSQFDA